MARIKLTVPDHFVFSTNIKIRISDINYGGHVGNDTILSLIHEARVLFLKEYQLSELKFGDVSLIMSNVIIEFKKELFYDDSIQIKIAVTELTRVGFELFYLIMKDDETIVALASTGMICYDYNAKKIAAFPAGIKTLFEDL
ncbi:MAG TPA: thioesterase family protein [Chitinophagaceae bacterium]|nr:thioesterase family protein [Chitinophagaceae bacterium]